MCLKGSTNLQMTDRVIENSKEPFIINIISCYLKLLQYVCTSVLINELEPNSCFTEKICSTTIDYALMNVYFLCTKNING